MYKNTYWVISKKRGEVMTTLGVIRLAAGVETTLMTLMLAHPHDHFWRVQDGDIFTMREIT